MCGIHRESAFASGFGAHSAAHFLPRWVQSVFVSNRKRQLQRRFAAAVAVVTAVVGFFEDSMHPEEQCGAVKFDFVGDDDGQNKK